MPRNEVAVRSTEGPKPTPNESRKRVGRPKGSTNKPKSLVPKELANELLLLMKDQLPPEHFAYMKGVINEGKAISTKQELDTMLLLLGRNLYPFLIEETKPKLDEDGNPVPPEFRKDVTERLKVWKSLLDTRAGIEKNEKPEEEGETPVLKLWASRSMEGRVAVLVNGAAPDGPESVNGGHPLPALPPGSPAGDDDGAGRGTDEA